jgi:drug/metabolite transporter (DMT)-like permease
MTPRELATLVLLAAVWGGSFLFIRVAVPELGPFPLVLGRVAIAGVLLAALAAARRQPVWAGIRRHWRPILVLGAANAALPFSLISAAELHLTASLASVLNATVPLATALLGAAWARERISAKRGAGLLLGVVGVAVLVGWSPLPRTLATVASVAAMLGATVSYAFAALWTRRRLAGVSAPTLALGQQLGAAAWLAVPAAATLPAHAPSPAAMGALLALGTLSTAAAYLLWFWLMARVGATRTASVTYLVPVFGTTWGALFLGERLGGGMLAGLAVILASVVLVNDIRLPRRRAAAAPAGATPERRAA